MTTIETSGAVSPFAGGPRHAVLEGVERGPGWRRWGRLPEPGAVVDLVPSLHPDRLNVIDDTTLELIGSIPRRLCPAFAGDRQVPNALVVTARSDPAPVIVIALPA